MKKLISLLADGFHLVLNTWISELGSAVLSTVKQILRLGLRGVFWTMKSIYDKSI